MMSEIHILAYMFVQGLWQEISRGHPYRRCINEYAVYKAAAQGNTALVSHLLSNPPFRFVDDCAGEDGEDRKDGMGVGSNNNNNNNNNNNQPKSDNNININRNNNQPKSDNNNNSRDMINTVFNNNNDRSLEVEADVLVYATPSPAERVPSPLYILPPPPEHLITMDPSESFYPTPLDSMEPAPLEPTIKRVNVHWCNDRTLIAAVANNHVQTAAVLVDQFGANVHASDDTPLRLAVRLDRIEMAVMLMRRGANSSAADDYAFLMAGRNNNLAMVHLLRGDRLALVGVAELRDSGAEGVEESISN